ncbi:MAG TPA: HNH endonuclease [Gemmataceae bacterium]|nr:HNH endonuclease [Gemmataceae bacterium]
MTWHNLGYRFGQHYGSLTAEQIDATFDILAVQWERVWGASSEEADSAAPSADQYITAFRKVRSVTDSQIQMLRLHYNAPQRTITATQMARAIGYRHYSIANSQYGRLGRLVSDQLEYNPMKERLGTLVTFEKRQGEWHWLMRPQVARALERLGWVEGFAFLLPEEIAATLPPLVEGAVCRVSVNAYERSPEARQRCIAAHGTSCCICGFSFGAMYGEVAEGYIHVHHLRPLSEIGGAYRVVAEEDLRPVCPNCHAVLHRRIPAYSIAEVQSFVRSRGIAGTLRASVSES